jgi:hypothetical protein
MASIGGLRRDSAAGNGGGAAILPNLPSAAKQTFLTVPPNGDTNPYRVGQRFRHLHAYLSDAAKIFERAPIVLCCLEGNTRDEAAQSLGWSVSTLKRRLDAAGIPAATRRAAMPRSSVTNIALTTACATAAAWQKADAAVAAIQTSTSLE